MSRIGTKPVTLPANVKVAVQDGKVSVSTPKVTLEQVLPEGIEVAVNGPAVEVRRTVETRQGRALHGLIRSLIANMVRGVTEGYKKELEIRGVGYRAQLQGTTLNLFLGYSHPIAFPVPAGITITVIDNTRMTVTGADKQLVGAVSAAIRALRPPDVYQGKGVRYLNEYVRQKVGKSV